MSTVRKFTFDLDFDAPVEPVKPEPEVDEQEPEEVIPTFSEEEVEQARTEGFDAGKEEGRREAADATEQKLLETIEQACEKLSDVYNTQTDANRQIGREMISVATAIAKKMFPDLNSRNALGEVERVVQETLKAVTEEPRIQIMVNPELREPLTERLGTMTHRAGFEGKVFVNPDPSMPLGDCRIEWSNGAAVRNVEEMWEMIDKIIDENLHDGLDDASEAEEADASPASEADTEADIGTEIEAEADEADAATTEQDELEQVAPEQDASETDEAVQEQPSEADAASLEEPDAVTEATAPEAAEIEAESSGEAPEDMASEVDAMPDAGAEISEPEMPAAGPGADAEAVDIDETPSWQAAVGESAGVNAAPEPEPAPAPEADPGVASDDSADETDAASTHGPSFAPTFDASEIESGEENDQLEQHASDDVRDAPIPHVEDATDAETPGDTDSEAVAAPVTDPDPVSPATQAAILDAQSALDDEDENPSGG